jgi:uncharacterized protein YigA (DUF484 family)
MDLEKHTMDANAVAQYLQDHSDFFEQHAELFSTLKVPHPHEGRAIPLAERQVLALRERVRGMELRVAELVRNAAENEHIADNLQRWSRALLKEPSARKLPDVLTTGLADIFSVPDVALRVWGLPVKADGAAAGDAPAWQGSVTDDVRSFTNSLMSPYCGPNSGFEAATWLERSVGSIALIPLRVGLSPQAFGLLVLASPDPDRFSPSMGTAFLARIGEVASASLSRLLAD